MSKKTSIVTEKKIYVFTTMEAEGKGWDPIKLAKAPPPRVIHYWPFLGGILIVVLFVNCYVVFHFPMFFF